MPQKLRSETVEPEPTRMSEAGPARRTRSRTARSLGFFLWERRWFVFAILLGAVLLTLPTPDGLTREGWITIVISVVSIVLFVAEPVPLPTVALMIIAGQVLLLGIDSTTVAKSLMNDSVLFIMGSLMLAVAIVKQKLDKRIAYLIVRMTGTKTVNISFGIALVSGILASVMGEHTVAAMMLPVALTLITLTSEDPKEVRKLAAVLLFSICYGCSIAGIGTPSGGARNAIMVDYWRQFFHDPADPATDIYLVDYATWIAYCYPIFLIQLPFLTGILYFTFRPRKTNLSRAVVKLRRQIEKEGSMKLADWLAIFVFLAILLAWITLSDVYGLGTIALIGVVVFLVIGLVRWEDVNSGVNWGVVLLYAAAISLGVQMKDSGAALWIANGFLELLSPLGVDSGLGLWAAISVLTTGVTNTMSNGAAVAVLGPITLNMADAAGESPLVIGFVTAVSSAFAYLTVIGTPACTIVYSSGYLKTTEFLMVGVRMLVVSTVVLLLAAWLYWPLLPQ
ncbi:MAG: DASS family sodium-coupled anion symporter [Pseudomonadota bacterium]